MPDQPIDNIRRERVLDDGSLQFLPTGDDTLDRLYRGEVLILRGALQGLRWLDPLREMSLAVIADAAGESAARRVRQEGFESIHRHLDGAQIEAVYLGVSQGLRGSEVKLLQSFRQHFAPDQDCYGADKSWVRFFVPQDEFARNRERFSRRVGHLRLQNPHRDSWFTNPSNALVLWAAMSAVEPGNGMLIYPRMWRRPVAHRNFEQNGHRICADERPGRPIDFSLQAGDLLLFHGEHLHSSELNRTDKTRFVISLRLTQGAPVYGEGARWIAYRSLRLYARGHARLAGLRSRLSPAYVRFLLQRRLAYEVRRALSPGTDAASSSIQTAYDGKRQPTVPPPELSLPELKPGLIVPVSEEYCAALTERGPVLFSRYCPHEGADLAGGWMDGRHLRCPWHNLRIDLQSGRQSCRTLQDLRVYPLRPVAGGRYVTGESDDDVHARD